jgi:GNAT superfamily N-acetyltransferase
MLTTSQVDTSNNAQVNRFVMFHYKLYANDPQWVPPFISDIKLMLNRKKHPFYELSDADFFIAERDGEVVGRVAVMENKPFNQYHGTRQAQFYLFDSINDQEVANALFDRAADWAKKRNLNAIVGPKGFSAFDGYGIQIEGTEHRQMMTMMNYNFPYYRDLVEKIGFEKEVDFVSCYIPRNVFKMPERVHEVARRVLEKGSFAVKNFSSKREMLKWGWRLGQAYNKTFIHNWEYYPLTEGEIKLLVDNLMVVLDHRLIKLITYKEDIVGFLLAFPDISAALQRQKGRITPWGALDFMHEMKTTKWLSLNGAGVLPEYQGRGGNALLYSEMEKAVEGFPYEHLELTQVAETAVQMRKDLISVGGKAYKNHRVYHIEL